MSGAADKQLFHELVTTANALFVSDADFVTINGVTKPTLKKIYAEFLASMGTYTTVAAGLAATSGTGTNNRFFSVPGTGDVFETRYRNDAGVAVEISSLLSWLADTLTINKGKAYPLRSMNRGGTTSPPNAVMNRFLLNCEVIGAEPGKYYLISLQKNGATGLVGTYEFGWILLEADAATYATTGAFTQIHSLVDPAPDISRTGGVQTITVTPQLRPDIRFKITVDAAGLPAAGTAIDSSSTGSAGRSWIVDPSRYTALPIVKDDSLTLNIGKSLPLRSMNRGGVTSIPNTVMNRLLLKCEVLGAVAGKYYLISLQKNGAPGLAGSYEFGWILYEADASTYAATGTVTMIHTYSDPAPDINRTGGIQTITVRPALRQEMRFQITLDAAALPSVGVPVDSNSSGTPGRSWIVDPSCYVEAPYLKDDALTINKGKNYPLRPMVQGGVTSPVNTVLNSFLLNCEVSGADPTKYYKVAFQKNGAPLFGDYTYGWIFQESDRDDYGAVTDNVVIHNYSDPAPDIDRDGGVQTLIITPKSRPGIKFKLTIDAAALPALGVAINANSTGASARSWIVDPSRYTYANASATSKQLQAGRMWVEGETTGNNFDFIWSHGANHMFMQKFGPNQVNQLFNFKGWRIAPLATVESAAWEDLGGWSTDWLPPLTLRAVNNGDGGKVQYTGGGHWDETEPTQTTPTARMVNLKCSINGQEMAEGQTYSGPADYATFSWQVEVFAYNTMTLGRYVGRQHFVVHVRPGAWEVLYAFEALEDVVVEIDNGPQMGVYSAFPEWVHYIGDDRGPLLATDPAAMLAQPSNVAPDVFAAVCFHPARGFCASWMDRSYEAGDGRYVSPTLPFARKNSGSWKFYQAAISGKHTAFQAGQGYKWRGGYAVAPVDIVQGDVNCAFQYTKGGKPWLAWALNAAGTGRVTQVPSVAGRTIGENVVGSRGLDVSSASYAFGNAEIK